jgi:hypothetical protein
MSGTGLLAFVGFLFDILQQSREAIAHVPPDENIRWSRAFVWEQAAGPQAGQPRARAVQKVASLSFGEESIYLIKFAKEPINGQRAVLELTSALAGHLRSTE